MKPIVEALPQYDYIYLGDTKNLPYGEKSHHIVYEYTKEAVDHLFRKENCALVIVACNTASARALRRIQQEYLPKNFSDRKALGVLIPAAEVTKNYKRIGILATSGTVASNTFPVEIKKVNGKAKVFQNAAPELVPLIEAGKSLFTKPLLLKYLKPLLNKKLDALVLGCTHYPILKKEIRKIADRKIKIISQEEIIPKKLQGYLKRHPEITKKLSRNKRIKILVTKKTPNMSHLVKKWFGSSKINTISKLARVS